MNAYIYQAALLCKDCALITRAEADANLSLDSLDKETSDFYPQGPYPDGGGEADCPQHCDHCHTFLENPLTQDGYSYVEEALDNYPINEVTAVWRDFYRFERQEDGTHISDEMVPR